MFLDFRFVPTVRVSGYGEMQIFRVFAVPTRSQIRVGSMLSATCCKAQMEKILIVDDEPDFQAVLAMFLESQGYRVESGNSGVEALSIFENDPPDLVISDVMMPEMDGFEFCRRLRETRLGQLVPFIFLSSQGELETRVAGHSIGADDYLVKPFQSKEILAKVKAQLERHHRIHAEIIRLLQQSSTDAIKPTSLNAVQIPEPLPLTPAEEKVFWEAIEGYTNKEISDRLFLSPRTVQAHLSSIFGKLQLENRAQLVRFALLRGYKPSSSVGIGNRR